MVPCEKSKIASFTSSRIKNIDLFRACSGFSIKLTYCNVFNQHLLLAAYLNLLQPAHNCL